MPFLKPVAAIIGYILFQSFFGAIIGWFAGSVANVLLIDGPKGLLPSGRKQIQQQRQETFLETLFSLMGKLAKADEKVSQSEIDHVEQFMVQMSMTGAHRKQAITYFQRGVKSGFQLEAVLENFMQVCGKSLQMKHLLLVYLASVALADGKLHADENALLAQIATRLGYSERAYAHLMAMIQGQNRFGGAGGRQSRQGAAPRRATNTLADAYQALGVTKSNTDKEVKRAYRKLISQYHPDKLIGQGVPEDMIKQATERSKEIHAAYELIEEHRKGQ